MDQLIQKCPSRPQCHLMDMPHLPLPVEAAAALPAAKSYCQAKVRPCEKAEGSDAVESCRQIASPGDKAGIGERRVCAVYVCPFEGR